MKKRNSFFEQLAASKQAAFNSSRLHDEPDGASPGGGAVLSSSAPLCRVSRPIKSVKRRTIMGATRLWIEHLPPARGGPNSGAGWCHGHVIQARDLDKTAFGAGHPSWSRSVGNNDILVLTAPEEILAIHDAFLEAGSDIITTNTFNANAFHKGLRNRRVCAGDKFAAASLAFQMAEEWTALTPLKPRFVAGALGPTNKTASLSPDPNPAYRAITFDDLVAHYSTRHWACSKGY